ncbi:MULTISPECIES: hypothetical protein [unclassified Caulobacter]|jgi:hypothetical protein|uniref:hypothetical protein n=1 Tax=unclassified Caulobacter TaxID=2648921 RepID=UPI0006F28BDC|nr:MULTISPECIES: hypothetical protein [unclassified Caulobacter]KQV62434.1 hypothetical protein ASC62_02545 [Caulobacter sp. Root342]KQV65556.1 hypothetical protein ASC70_17755 [Caulobacter sp. Root343]
MTRHREILLTFVVLLVGVACAASLAIIWGMKSSDVAAWAQAVGTVGAIVATIVMTNRQIDALRREKQRERDDLVRAIGDAFRAMLDGLSTMEAAIQLRNEDGLPAAIFSQRTHRDTTVNKFLEMPIERWPGATLYIRALDLTAARDAFEGSAADVLRIGPGPRGADLWEIAEICRQNLVGAAERFWTAHSALLSD